MPEDAVRAEHVLSFYRVRQALGFLGLLLPFLLIAGGLLSLGGVEPSISDYYHTLLRDIFVGTLAAIGVFLIAYPGHGRQDGEWLSDDRLTTLAGIAALGVAFFPNEDRLRDPVILSPTQLFLGQTQAAIGHYACAIIFLLLLGILCLFRFARTSHPARRRIYRVCGGTILVMTLAVVIASWFKIRGPAGPQQVVNDWMLVLWFETVAIWAFALAWLTKGRADLALARISRRPRRQPAAAPVPTNPVDPTP